MKKHDRLKLLQRYEKERTRNVMARPGKFSFILVLDNLKAGYNVAKIFRTAQAFGAAEIHLINIPPFDPAPAKGAVRKVPARFYDTMEESLTALRERGYRLFTLEPETEQELPAIELPEKSAFIFGHEEFGFSFERSDHPDIVPIRIPQYGEVQSLNVSIAASVVMYEYVRGR